MQTRGAGLASLALLMGGIFTTPTLCSGKTDSVEINKLLSEVNDHAIQLRADSDKMAAFTRSNSSWESYAVQLNLIKDHINAAGKFLANLNSERVNGSVWQQTAIDRINPLLKELATNTEIVINKLNENPNRVHMTDFRDYVQVNADLSSGLAHTIGDFVDYGNTKTKLERLAAELELN